MKLRSKDREYKVYDLIWNKNLKKGLLISKIHQITHLVKILRSSFVKIRKNNDKKNFNEIIYL